MAAAPSSPVPPLPPVKAAPVRKVPTDCPLALLPTEVVQGVSESSVSALKRTEFAGKVVGALSVALVATLYYITLYPSLPGGDSGELIVASCSLGLPHPPGYPLFAMIGWLFTHIPYGSMAWRVNLFSAVCGVVASAFLYLAIFRVCLHTHYASTRVDADSETDSSAGKPGKPKEQQLKADDAHSSMPCGFASPVPWAAAFATLMFALSPLVWFYSVQAEVFAVNNMFVGVLVAGAVLFWERRSDSIAMIGAFSVGLGFTNQHTLVFYAFPLCTWALFNKPSLLAPATFIKLCCLGLLGLTPYIYLPIVSINGAPLGGWGDQSDFAGFKKHFLREEYGTFRLFSGNEQRGDQLALALKMYFFNYSTQSLHLGWPLAVAGIYLIASCSKRAIGAQFKGWNLLSLLLFIARYVFYMVVFHFLSNLPIEQALFFGVHIRFWMQPNAITAIFVGVGMLFLLRVLKKLSGMGIQPLVPILAAVIAARIVKSWPVCDQSDNVTLRHYGEAHLGPMPKNAVMIVKGDIITNSMRYLRVCENVRTDTTHLDQSMMTYPWFKPQQKRHFVNITFPNLHYHPYEKLGYSMQQFLDKNWKPPSQRPFYLCGGWYHNELPGITDQHDPKEWGTPGYFTIPMGFCDLILKEGGREMPIKTWMEMLEKQIPSATEYFPPAIGHHADDTWEHGAFWALNKGIVFDASKKPKEKAKAAEYFQASAELYEKVLNSSNPQFPGKESWAAATYKNVGIAYGRLQHILDNSRKMALAFEIYLARSDPKVDPADQRFEMHRLVTSYRTTVGYGESGPNEEQAMVQQRHVAADHAYQELIKKQRQKSYK